ncbi:MAG TPA: DUF535 family protein [Luteibacter sp.]|uniref:VirK/YbjX family protein n=1 Tax=Luteibacter sp. TaxID=1886636 RepID=UPI002C9C1CDD|nr:DUF535 family protein [Luteibacter sp.]HVI53550.1 DUF535 family protein [Luteibacter sp.]
MSALQRFVASFRERNDWRSQHARRAAGYAARCLVAPLRHLRWLGLLQSHPALRDAARRDGRLVERWQHRFVSRSFGARKRLAALMDHYRFVVAALPQGLLERMYAEGQVTLAEASMKNGEPLRVLLMPPTRRGCEGELNVALATADDTLLFSATITVLPSSGELLVGCLQGPNTEDGQERVRLVTRQCHGLRPKNLLLSLLYGVATAHGLSRLRGISNDGHARSGRIKASYDTFWIESAGVLARDGFFDLPAVEPERNELDVASKHRSAFRQREALRRELVATTLIALGQPTIDAVNVEPSEALRAA